MIRRQRSNKRRTLSRRLLKHKRSNLPAKRKRLPSRNKRAHQRRLPTPSRRSPIKPLSKTRKLRRKSRNRKQRWMLRRLRKKRRRIASIKQKLKENLMENSLKSNPSRMQISLRRISGSCKLLLHCRNWRPLQLQPRRKCLHRNLLSSQRLLHPPSSLLSRPYQLCLTCPRSTVLMTCQRYWPRSVVAVRTLRRVLLTSKRSKGR